MIIDCSFNFISHRTVLKVTNIPTSPLPIGVKISLVFQLSTDIKHGASWPLICCAFFRTQNSALKL